MRRNNWGNHRSFKRENRNDQQGQKRPDKPVQETQKKAAERPHWTAPLPNSKPLPVLNCGSCGQAIIDVKTAMTDKRTGSTVHFDCVLSTLSQQERLEKGDSVSYIGGGRFGIVNFQNENREPRFFSIKKIIEWEDRENRAEWRHIIADRYSTT